MKKALLICFILLYTVGCSHVREQVEEQTNNESEASVSLGEASYPIIMHERNENRGSYYATLNSTNDFHIVGRELMRLSLPYFSNDNHYMAEGQYLGASDFNQLLMRTNLESSEIEYPFSLQPERGREIGGISNPVMVVSVYEQNFYSDDKGQNLVGASFAIVIDPLDEYRSQLSSPMSDDTIRDYGEEIIPILYEYLTSEEGLGEYFGDIPINICVYQAANKVTSQVDGRFILQSFHDGELGNITALNHRYVIFSSSDAEELDRTTATDFAQLVAQLRGFSVEGVGVIGIGEYKDNVIQSLNIEATLNVKTYGELQFFVSRAAQALDSAFSEMFYTQMIIRINNDIEAIIVKNIGQRAEITMIN